MTDSRSAGWRNAGGKDADAENAIGAGDSAEAADDTAGAAGNDGEEKSAVVDSAATGSALAGSAVIDSAVLPPQDSEGRPIPVTIPVVLAPGVVVRFTTRLGGVSTGDWACCNLGSHVGDEPEHVAANMTALERVLGESLGRSEAHLRLVHQVHSATAIDADDYASRGVDTYQVDADAQVTARAGVPLGIFAADCLPVLYADPVAGIVAASHCGRAGLQRGVVAGCVEQMVRQGAQRGNIRAMLGPCICGDCYEVGEEIAQAFDAQFPGAATVTRFGGAGIDIATAARQALAEQGIDGDRIVDARPRVAAATKYLEHDAELETLCGEDNEGDPQLAERLGALAHPLCTLENPLWYSHRRAYLAHKAHEGRMLAVVMREA